MLGGFGRGADRLTTVVAAPCAWSVAHAAGYGAAVLEMTAILFPCSALVDRPAV